MTVLAGFLLTACRFRSLFFPCCSDLDENSDNTDAPMPSVFLCPCTDVFSQDNVGGFACQCGSYTVYLCRVDKDLHA